MTARVTKVTDGTDIVDFEDASSGYTIISHRLAVAERVDGLVELYGPVDEVIELSVEGSTPTELAQRLNRLTRLVDKARRLWRGEALTPVIFQYRIDNSTLTNPLQALVMGAPESGDVLTLPESFDNYTQLKTGDAGDPVVWRFRRRGALLGDEESDASSSTANPGVMTATNTATDLPSPVKLTLTNYVSQMWGGSFLVVSDDADKMDLLSCAAAALENDDYVQISDSSKRPLDGTDVLRYTPPSTDWVQSGEIDIQSLLLSDTREILVFINARRNSAAMSALTKIEIRPGGPGGYNYMAPVVAEPIQLTYDDWYLDTAINPQWYRAGLISLPVGVSVPTNMYLSIWTKTSSTASTIDYDALFLVDARGSFATFVPFNRTFGLATEPTLTIDHSLLTHVDPQTTVSSPTGMNLGRNGARIFSAQSAEVAAIWLSNGVSASPTPLTYYWCAVDITTGAKLSNVLTAVRRPAFLVPQ